MATCNVRSMFRCLLVVGVFCGTVLVYHQESLRIVFYSQQATTVFKDRDHAAFYVSTPCSDRPEAARRICQLRKWTGELNFHDPQFIRALPRYHVDEKHQVIYCALPKVASSTFKYLMAKSLGNLSEDFEPFRNIHRFDVLKAAGIRKLNTYSEAEIEHLLKSYRKFVVVRHPFDRLHSLYTQKFSEDSTNRDVASSYYNLIHKTFPGLYSNSTPQLSLQHLLELVAWHRDDFHNPHWKPYWKVCDPCLVQFDSIVKLETIDSDIQEILDWFNVSKSTLTLVNSSRNKTAESKLREVTRAFSDIDPGIIEKLRQAYSRDFELFGYEYDERGVSCDNSNSKDGSRCC